MLDVLEFDKLLGVFARWECDEYGALKEITWHLGKTDIKWHSYLEIALLIAFVIAHDDPFHVVELFEKLLQLVQSDRLGKALLKTRNL